MDALGQPRSRTPRRLAAGAVTLGLVLAGLAVWQSRSGPDGPDSTGEQTAELAATGVLRLTRDSAGSPVKSLDVPLGSGAAAPALERTASGAAATAELRTTRFSMLGLTWHGRGEPVLAVRTHRVDGGWTRWQRAPEMEDGTAAEGTPGLRATDPIWVGASDGVRVRVRGGTPKQLKLTLIDPGTLPTDATAGAGRSTGVSRAPVGFATRAAAKPTSAPEPRLLPRSAWGADPSWRNGEPTYIKKIRQVHIHHTATTNDYAPEDVPGLLRGMYRYHTKTLGWFDIGYNFLVDRFGRAWVGRSGGASKPVRGAHTLGFNHQSVGIALIGRFGKQEPSERAITKVVRLAAWKLDMYGGHPRETIVTRSLGSDRFPAGTKVRLHVIDGHRDTNETSCPGDRVYERLAEIRRRAGKRVHRYDP